MLVHAIVTVGYLLVPGVGHCVGVIAHCCCVVVDLNVATVLLNVVAVVGVLL